MAHTLREQEITLDYTVPPVDAIINLFVQEFGYTKSGDYYFSPTDRNFGIRVYNVTGSPYYTYIVTTFDGGKSEYVAGQIYHYTSYYPKKMFYQVSQSEKVIMIRFIYYHDSSVNRMFTFLIAHDDKGETACFKSSILIDRTTAALNATIHNVNYMDKRKITTNIACDAYSISSLPTTSFVVNNYLSNTIYRYPSHNNQCMFSELYGIVNLTSYDYSYTPSYIRYNDTVYRIVSFSNSIPGDTTSARQRFFPHFAFPVSDQEV